MGVYARILNRPRIAALIAATTITRLPFAINGLAIVLFLRSQTGSFAVAGLVAGALALGAALGAPFAGRLVDRRGVSMLLPLALTHAAAVLAIWGFGEAGAPAGLLAGLALLAGATFPPAGAVLRSRWPELVGDPQLVPSAYALDSVMIEVSFVVGPLITAAIVVLTGAQAALGVSAALAVGGTVLFLSQLPGEGRPTGSPHGAGGLLGAFAHPAIRTVALSTLPVGFCIGAIEVALPAFSEAHGSAALAGVLLAIWSAASGVGGLAFGARGRRGGLVETFLLIALLFPLACLPLAAASSPAAMVALVVLAGAPIAPLIASRNELVGAVAPRGTSAESFTWLMTALVAGISVGNAAAGALIEAEGWPAAVLLGCGVAVLGAAFAYSMRERLRPAYAAG